MRALKYYLPTIIWAGIIFFLSSIPGSSCPAVPFLDKIGHFIEYGVLGYLIIRLIFYLKTKSSFKNLIFLSLLLGGFYGLTDEIHQLFIPFRSCNFFDWLTDLLGVSGGIFVFLKTSRAFKKPKLLLHICCSSCGTYVIKLLKEKYRLKAYFYNPNIQPREEYEKRLKDVERMSKELKVFLIKGRYDIKEWFDLIKGYENEREGGKRCEVCFKMRLEKTAELAKKFKFDYFATSLTVGPQKEAKIINSIGRQLGKKYGIMFYEADFKKKNGFKKSVELSREQGFYRQNYCGCVFSQKDSQLA